MSYCLSPYRIDFTRLLAVRGSRDKALLAQVEGYVGPRTDATPPPQLPLDVIPDHWFVGSAECMRRVVHGGVWGPEHEESVRTSMLVFYQYCCGQPLDRFQLRNAGARLAAADRALEARLPALGGLVTRLFTGGLPDGMVMLPVDRRFGHLTADTVAAIRRQAEGVTLDDLPKAVRSSIESAVYTAGYGMGLMGIVAFYC